MKTVFSSFILSLLFSILTACGGGEDTVILPPTAPDPPVIEEPAPEPPPEPIAEPAIEPAIEPEPEPIAEPPPLPEEPVIEEPIIEPEPTPEPEGKRIIFIYDATAPEMGTSDGIYYYQLATDRASNAHDGFISIGDILHGIDDTGTSIITQRLPCTPDAVAISGDVWSFENIDPATAASLGALPRWHTKIWQGSTEYGNWSANQWQTVTAIVTNSGDVVTTDTVGKLRSIKEPDLDVRAAIHSGIMIHTTDAVNLSAFVRDNRIDTKVYGASNYFLSANKWIEADGIWYSWNGFTWDGSVFSESAAALRDFIVVGSDSPVVVPVGSIIEHSESVTYWIECNTGWLYRHTPSIDRLETVIQLYQGSGFRVDGVAAAAEIKPVLAGPGGDNIFFTWNGTVWKYNFTDALVSSFAAGVLIWGM